MLRPMPTARAEDWPDCAASAAGRKRPVRASAVHRMAGLTWTPGWWQ
jgi:hypothetical protein